MAGYARLWAWVLAGFCGVGMAAAAVPATYSMDDFARVRKFDAHVHANADSDAFLQQARSDNFELLSINVDYPDFPPIGRQREIALALARTDPARFHWAATFSMQGFGSPGWAQAVGDDLAGAVAQGARAVKIWKNVGMVERGADGKLVMLDDPGLAPVAERVQALGVPLIDHQGEPYNCWLPLEQMSTDNDREYFREHPQYHAWLHPEQPRYEELMAARDRFVAAHPRLGFVGAHAASLEWSVDRLAAFLDRFPNATVDLAARMGQIQYQSVRDRGKVRDFFVRYQDRLLYGTDLTQAPDSPPEEFRREAHAVWLADWRYLATAETQRVADLHADVPGLALPREVIDKVYYGNALRVFGAGERKD
ncbi:MAG: amidohydrolase family protein [Pseudoxanthomonas sp.]